MIQDVIIIGGGQAGLVTGYHLQQHNLDFLILDANEIIGGSWLRYWDSVQLFSAAKYSTLDGLPFPGDPSHYPDRAEVIAYLQQYADHFNLPVVLNTRIDRIEKHGDRFHVITTDGRVYQSRAVIAATGPFNKPNIPPLPGQDVFHGEQVHTYHYHEPSPYQGQRIVVVGSNNSAVQVGCELATVADVSLAVRKDIKFAPKQILGIDVFFFFHRTGLDMLPIGCPGGDCTSATVYDDGRYQAMVTAGNPDPRPMFHELTSDGVIWSDGTHEQVDTIIYATGFDQHNRPYLHGLDALDPDGNVLHHKGVSTMVSGLFYVGLDGQIAPASATLRGVSRDARYIARQLTRYLEDVQSLPERDTLERA